MQLQILQKVLLQLENRTLKIYIASDEVRNQDMENGAYHSTYEIFYQIAGGTQFRFPRSQWVLKEGELGIIPVGVPHAEEVIQPERFKTLVISNISNKYYFWGCRAAQREGTPIFAESLGCYFLNDFPTVFNLLEECRNLASQSRTRIFTYPLLSVVFQLFIKSLNGRSMSLETLYSSEIVNAASYMIRERFSQSNLNVQAMAEYIKCSPNYLSALFRKEVGQTISQVLLQTRLTEAQQLICRTKLPVLQVGRHCGFMDSSYFIKQFKLKFGSTPKEYRFLGLSHNDLNQEVCPETPGPSDHHVLEGGPPSS